tara:strand:- start:7386 stop:8525 length:1140 start_codon:yes stop_codon:yes gene_type:complete
MTVNIYLTGDSGEAVSTELRIDDTNVTSFCSPAQFRNALEPTIASINWMLNSYLGLQRGASDRTIKVEIGVDKFICVVEKRGSRYLINGKSLTKDRMLTAVSKTIYLSTTTNKPISLFNKLYESIDIPENVSFALENRAPYYWYENYQQIKVSLNVMQISDKECAIEISDNVWGNISIKDLNTFMNYYRLGKKRGSWKMLSPASLWGRLLGKMPSETQLSLMKAFLMQNRTQDIVEERAEQLLSDLLAQYPDKLKLVSEIEVMPLKPNAKVVHTRKIYVRGKLSDWCLTERKQKHGYQLVSTFMFTLDETKLPFQHGYLNGPICIDNLNSTSSVGDQFATRAIALMNDNIIVKRVSTIDRRLKDREIGQTEIRIDFDAL